LLLKAHLTTVSFPCDMLLGVGSRR
jgi:hypothetical protein